MQKVMSLKVAAALAGICAASAVSAHPGHAPADPVAQLASPLAGPDHFAAFLALASILLLALRMLAGVRAVARQKARR